MTISFSGNLDNKIKVSGVGPQGPEGPVGATGPSGLTGATGPTVYPAAGIAVSTGTAWTTSKTSPTGDFVGTTDTQTITNKTLTNPLLTGFRETVHALTYASSLAPNAANGTVQTVTLTGNVTINGFTSPISGQTVTLIITQDATGNRTLTSTMKFAGAQKTLSTAGGSVDILTITYVGTTYYASLVTAYS